jgi:cytochrome P450
LKLQNFLGLGRVRELREGYAVLEDVGCNHIIEERRKQLEENAKNGDTRDYCLLDSLLRATDENGKPLPRDDVWGDVNDIMAAGHRTTASNLTVNLHHLSRMPEIQRKVAEEVAALHGRPPTFKDVQDGKLQYTQRVVKESLRKYAPINLFPRLVEDRDVLPSGHEVRPGDFILLSSWAMGRNPRVWQDPNAFDPDRFTDENLRLNAERLARESAGADADEASIALQMERMSRRIAGGRDFTYTPFGSGPRSCIGGTFALLATTVNLASMVQRFEFSVDSKKDPGFELPFFYDTTITFPKGAHVLATPRPTRLGAENVAETAAEHPAAAGAR